MKNNCLGNNIKALRNAYDETLEQLAEIVGVTKSAIKNYENGSREPSKETLDVIAKHYIVSVDELLHCDFSGLKKIIIGDKSLWNYIDFVFPLINSNKAKEQKSFAKAYDKHRKAYEIMRKMKFDSFSDFREAVDYLESAMDNYIEAYEDENIKIYAAANFLAVWYLQLFMIKTVPELLKNNPASLSLASKNNHKMKRYLDAFDSNKFDNDSKGVLEYLTDDEMESVILEYENVISESDSLRDLAYYYCALKYVYNLVDNEMGIDLNRTIGTEMMYAYLDLSNEYAINFIIVSRILSGQVHNS